ncbi:DNA repair and recombination protein RAD26 [Achlya hypogyna]|uniref:DNA repair and recombination protein RAD26 n=1 Tax=Achlya hypogyna TaxID=1202772 RepID=A0A1V9Z8A1_ACHHY|nr:DNA repair and recombination protein RAD26 [Achlya hypogyna]
MDLLSSSDDESDAGQRPVPRVSFATYSAPSPSYAAALSGTPEERKPMMSVFERLLALNPRASNLPLFRNATQTTARSFANVLQDQRVDSAAPALLTPASAQPCVSPPLAPLVSTQEDAPVVTISYPSVPSVPQPPSPQRREEPAYISPFGRTKAPRRQVAPAKQPTTSTQFISQNELLLELRRASANSALSDDDWLSDAEPVEATASRRSARAKVKASNVDWLDGADVTHKRKSSTAVAPVSKCPPRERCQRRLCPSPPGAKAPAQSTIADDDEEDEDNTWPRLPPPEGVSDDPLVLLEVPTGSYTRPIQVPGRLNRFLQPYQREGVAWMFQAIVDNRGAILGDEMGLGKTVQVIALLSALLFKTGTAEDKAAFRRLAPQRDALVFDVNGTPPPILIVVPASLLANWELELKVWMCCRPVILNGKPAEREAVLAGLHRGTHDVVICSYDMLKSHLVQIQAVPWYLVVLDEMHNLKNPEARTTQAVRALRCTRRLGLTGTLMQNDTDELHCLLETIHSGALGSLSDFRAYYADDIKFARKKSAAPEAVARARAKEQQLRARLEPYYLRRDKAVHPTFATVHKSDKIVFCELTPLQRRAYERVLASADFTVLARGDERCDCGRDQRRRRCCHTTGGVLWRQHHPDGKACASCPACLQFPCIAQLLKLSNHLDLLRVDRTAPDDVQATTRAFAKVAFGEDLEAAGGSLDQAQGLFEKMNPALCGKMVVLEKLLTTWARRHEKVLLFSRSVRMLDILQSFLVALACAFVRLDGSTKVDERLRLVQRFNADRSLRVFLISTRAGGLGLNITSATNVVIFDPSWNPAHDCQAQDRAYRIGQTKDVKVFRLVTLGTIEEMIYARQIYKQQLADTTLKGTGGPRYFEAIIGVKGQHGELFGIRNLLGFKPDGVMKAIQDHASIDGIPMADNRVDLRAPPTKAGQGTDELAVVEELELDQEISALAPQSVDHDHVLSEPPKPRALYTPAYLRD